MRIHSTLLALATSALVATGCGGGDANAPDNSHVGRYALESVDGARLPITVVDDPGYALTLSAGAITLNANNSFVQTITLEWVIDDQPEPPETLSCGGTYQRSGTSFTMSSTASADCDAATFTAKLNGNVLTIDNEGSELVFRR